MFYGQTALIDAKDLILSSSLVRDQGYRGMFKGCTYLVSAPQISATTIGDYGCYEMFSGCTSLNTIQNTLPANSVGASGYREMFKGCTALTSAPELPATELKNYCYEGMFQNCSTLTSIPELPATVLADNCYRYMFMSCDALKINTTVPGKAWGLPAGTTATGATSNMFAHTTGGFRSDPVLGTTYYVATDINTTTGTTTDWNTTSTWTGGIPDNNDYVVIDHNITIGNNATATANYITINNDKVLTVNPSAVLNVKNTLTSDNASKLVLKADANNSAATVIFANGLPKATVEMYFKGTNTKSDDTNNPEMAVSRIYW